MGRARLSRVVIHISIATNGVLQPGRSVGRRAPSRVGTQRQLADFSGAR